MKFLSFSLSLLPKIDLKNKEEKEGEKKRREGKEWETGEKEEVEEEGREEGLAISMEVISLNMLPHHSG